MLKPISPVSIIISSLLLFSSSSLASSWIEGYQPPQNGEERYQRKSSSSGGSRSFCENPLGNKQLSLVVPKQQVVHQTASNRPKLFIQTEGPATISVIFTLVDPDKIEPLVEKQIIISQSGYQQLSIPPEIKLQENKIYSWFIAIPCQNNPDKIREVLKASIQYISPTPTLKRSLAIAQNNAEATLVYAENGMWYDAVYLKLNNNKFASITEEMGRSPVLLGRLLLISDIFFQYI